MELMELKAGANVTSITPEKSMFLAGYPHVKRHSTGVHDPLLSSAVYLEAGSERILIIANDIIYAPKPAVMHARAQISRRIGIPVQNIMISATHTHSGPKTTDTLSNEADTAVPKRDPEYLKF